MIDKINMETCSYTKRRRLIAEDMRYDTKRHSYAAECFTMLLWH